jgi:mannose PTS system EIIA component
MIGVVICCHGKMGEGMRHAAEMIVGPQEQLSVVSVNPGDGGEDILKALNKAIAEVSKDDGALIVTDLFGGTPTNVGCAVLKESNVEVVTGFNLPLLIKALTGRTEEVVLGELARTASEYGRRHISVAGDLLKEKK